MYWSINIRLLVLLISFTGCQIDDPSRWEELCHSEGDHKSRPYNLSWQDRDELTYSWRFNETAIYDLAGDDQYDWNKLTGLSFHLWDNHKNSAMVGWRWTSGGDVELNAYFHIGGERVFTEIIAYIPIGEEFRTAIRRNGDGWVTVSIAGREVRKFMGECCNNDKSREIYPWFGGNNPAPQLICIERKFSH